MKLDLLDPTYSSRMEVAKKRSWIPRRSTSTRRYHRLEDATSGSVRTARLGGGADDGGGRRGRGRRFMVKIKRALKVRFPKKMALALLSSRPALLWTKLKDAYMNMMLSLAGNVGQLNGVSAFGNKRVPKARKVSERMAQNEFEDRLVYEIYKALMASRELDAAAASAAASAQRQQPTTATATIVAQQI